MGMVAVLSMNALAAPLAQTENYVQQVQHQIVQLKESGAFPRDIGITFKTVSEKKITDQRLEAEALLDISQETCNVNINVTQDMKVGFSGSTENREFFKSVTGAQTIKQEQLRTEYVLKHEASHCKLYEIKDVFKSGDMKIDGFLNQYYKFSGTSYDNSKTGDSSIYYMLHENFADTHAFMQMIKEHGLSQDLLKTMQQVQIERSEAAAQHNPDGMIVHNTEFALKELLKEENITKVMSLKSNQEMQEFSLQIANKGMFQTLSNNNSAQVINAESLENGAMTLMGNLMLKDTLGKTEKSNISINWENNALFEIASNTYKSFKSTNDVSGIKTQEQFNDFYKTHAKDLKTEIMKNVDARLSASYDKGLDIVASINEHVSLTAKTPNLNINQIKEQGIKDLEVVADMALKFTPKENIFKNISQIRTAATGSRAVKHIQP